MKFLSAVRPSLKVILALNTTPNPSTAPPSIIFRDVRIEHHANGKLHFDGGMRDLASRLANPFELGILRPGARLYIFESLSVC